jgi:hypothetical protein
MGSFLVLAGCAVGGDGIEGPQGSVDIALEIAPGVNVDEVEYEITREGMEPITGTLPVGDDPNAPISGTISGIPAGDGYVIILRATANGVDCEGSATFEILPGQTTSVSIVLQCRGLDPRGNVDVDGSFNFCPVITSASATPSQAAVGESINVTASAIDPDDDPLTYGWSATEGTFADASAPSTTYTCTVGGEQVVTIAVDDGRGCIEEMSMNVTCIDDGVPPPPEDAGVEPPPEDAGVEPPPDGICEGDLDACLACQCTECFDAMTACFDAEDFAQDGPAAGQARAELCEAVVVCGQQSGCTGQECFCGEGVDLLACALNPQGPCVSQIQAAAETTDPLTIAGRQEDTSFALGRANAVGDCAAASCAAECL